MGMMYFQVDEDKVEKVSEHLEKGLRYIGKAMQCVEDMMQGGEYGERYGYREDMANRNDDIDDDGINYRQGVRGTGPYSRMRRRISPMNTYYREPFMM